MGGDQRMKISNMATGKLLPVGQPMNTKKMFINKLKQDIGWMVVHCRWWSMPIWVGMICLSVGIFSSPSVFADQSRNWNADVALKALGPERMVKRSDGVINYPAAGKATLDLFQIHSMRDMVPRTTSYDQRNLNQVRFQLRASGEIFKVPKVVSGSYECTIIAKTKYSRWIKDNDPHIQGTGIQHLTVNLDKPYPNENLSDSVQIKPENPNSEADDDLVHTRISDLYFDVSCRGVNFSWQRNPDEKVEFDSDDNSPILSVLINGEELMSWSKPSLPPIKDPVTVLDPPVCGLDAGTGGNHSEAVNFHEALRSPGPYPIQLPTGGFHEDYGVAFFNMRITCTVSDKKSAGGVATLQFSAPQLADNNESIVVPGFDDALRIKVTPNKIGGNTKLAASNAMGRPVKLGPPTNPADVLYFTVGDTPNIYLSENQFNVQLWQVKALDPGTFGEFQATMNATLVVR
ncbi:hypothetical protein CE143_01185 [Photorhabdus luminescens]|uniref:Fimbrial protein n=2 Tax=Photorhabdus akhurstii TaxID=171438 RepID=A0ABX8LV12_9GAMM|nr:hypothetical protein B0X70_01185 [Photorhabdus akhurstii]UJD73739.1 hypothetical protein CE143_01185 [Photorhabdus luminescens]